MEITAPSLHHSHPARKPAQSSVVAVRHSMATRPVEGGRCRRAVCSLAGEATDCSLPCRSASERWARPATSRAQRPWRGDDVTITGWRRRRVTARSAAGASSFHVERRRGAFLFPRRAAWGERFVGDRGVTACGRARRGIVRLTRDLEADVAIGQATRMRPSVVSRGTRSRPRHCPRSPCAAHGARSPVASVGGGSSVGARCARRRRHETVAMMEGSMRSGRMATTTRTAQRCSGLGLPLAVGGAAVGEPLERQSRPARRLSA